MKSAGLVLAALALAATAAQAADKLDCDGPGYEKGMANLVLGTVQGGKVNFIANQSDKPKCPSADASCKRKGYLVEGDQVVVDKDGGTNGYVCVAYIGAKGAESDGWMPAANVKIMPAVVNWAGTWKRDTTSELDITKKGAATVDVSGEATGGGMPDAPNEGDIDADIDARAPYAAFAITGDKQVPFNKAGEYDCAVEMRQIENYIFVNDNNNCGGAAVTFSGLYAKQ